MNLNLKNQKESLFFSFESVELETLKKKTIVINVSKKFIRELCQVFLKEF